MPRCLSNTGEQRGKEGNTGLQGKAGLHAHPCKVREGRGGATAAMAERAVSAAAALRNPARAQRGGSSQAREAAAGSRSGSP